MRLLASMALAILSIFTSTQAADVPPALDFHMPIDGPAPLYASFTEPEIPQALPPAEVPSAPTLATTVAQSVEAATAATVVPIVPTPVTVAAVVPLSGGAEQWRDLAAELFPAESVAAVLSIISCESGGNSDSHNFNPATMDDSVGLMQINISGDLLAGRSATLRSFGYPANDRDSTVAVLKDPRANLQMGAYISGGYNWGPWTCRPY